MVIKKSNKNLLLLMVVSMYFWLLSISAHAAESPHITEIMYNPPGTDSGREWVEVRFSEDADEITDYYLRENEINHSIKPFDGYTPQELGEYIIIADNPAKFLVDYPEYSGRLYDSVFSLKNTGELVQLVNNNQDIIDSHIYTPFEETYESDVTLQLFGTEWEVGEATPGVEFDTYAVEVMAQKHDDSISSNDQKTAKTISIVDKKTKPIKPSSLFKMGTLTKNMVGYVGVPIDFLYTKDTKVHWAYGDGSAEYSDRGRHTYMFPGEYLVIGSYSEGIEEYVEYTKVVVHELQLEIGIMEENQGYLEIDNKSPNAINLERFTLNLREGSKYKYVFPRNTYILGGGKIKIPIRLLYKFNRGWAYKNTDFIYLEYPHGKN